MNSSEFNEIPDKELLRRIYVAQLRMMMDIEKIHSNVASMIEKIDSDGYKVGSEGNTRENPFGFRHLSEIHEDFDRFFHNFSNQLDEK